MQKTTKLEIIKQSDDSDMWFAIFGRFEARFPLRVATGGDGKTHGWGLGTWVLQPAQLIAKSVGYRELKIREAPDIAAISETWPELISRKSAHIASRG